MTNEILRYGRPERAQPLGIGGHPRVAALDGLRGLAILSVVGYHGGWPGFRNGSRGVDLFFVLSGFLITRILLSERRRTGAVSLSDFYLRRAWRILPAYWTFLVGYTVACVVVFRDLVGELAGSTVWCLAFATDIGIGWLNQDVLQAHTWSLAVEEHFYILYPIAIARLSTENTKRWILSALAVLLCWKFLTPFVIDVQRHPHWTEYGPDVRSDGILVGCLGGTIDSNREGVSFGPLQSGLRTPSVLVALALLVLGFSWNTNSSDVSMATGQTLVALGALVIILDCAERPSGLLAQALACWPLRSLGAISYSLYLWHTIALGFGHRVEMRVGGLTGWWIGAGVYVGGSIGVATASYLLIERPLVAYGRRRTLSRRTPEITG